jgi:dCMP deaminase
MDSAHRYRPSWDDYFMSIARIVATRSTCDRLESGAVLVKKNRIISTGYNGSPPGLSHCDDAGHLMEEGHCVRTIHGEHNVILQAATIPGTSTEGSTLYTKYTPCIHCAKYVIAAGIVRVVVGKLYRNATAMEYLRQAGVQVDIYQSNTNWNNRLVDLFSHEIPDRYAKEGDVKLK